MNSFHSSRGDDNEHDSHAGSYGNFDDLGNVGPNIFDMGDDTQLQSDPLIYPVTAGSHPSSTKSTDGLQHFLGFSHDDIFGQDSSIFN